MFQQSGFEELLVSCLQIYIEKIIDVANLIRNKCCNLFQFAQISYCNSDFGTTQTCTLHCHFHLFPQWIQLVKLSSVLGHTYSRLSLFRLSEVRTAIFYQSLDFEVRSFFQPWLFSEMRPPHYSIPAKLHCPKGDRINKSLLQPVASSMKMECKFSSRIANSNYYNYKTIVYLLNCFSVLLQVEKYCM